MQFPKSLRNQISEIKFQCQQPDCKVQSTMFSYADYYKHIEEHSKEVKEEFILAKCPKGCMTMLEFNDLKEHFKDRRELTDLVNHI